MGFIKPNLPDVDPDTFMEKPLMERMRVLVTDWVDNGFGSPRMVHTIYIVKLVFFYALGGVLVATLTSGLSVLDVSHWWNQPIVYQKAVLWTVLLELIGVAGSWGPLAGKVKPMTGGILFWARPGTIRLRPWKWVPMTGGDRRTWFDVGLYVVLMASVAIPLVSPGVHSDSPSSMLPGNASGLVDPVLLIAPIVLLVVMGLRDKIVFLAARGEQYLPALLMFALFPFVDMIIALKLLIVVVWVGAGVSKLGLHFTNVIPPMVSNSPLIPFKWLKRAHYRNYPEDLRPSHLAGFMAHGPGSVVEILAPLTLLFSTNKWVTIVAVVIMVSFHLFIISTFPLAVPLEWNVLFAYDHLPLPRVPVLERLRRVGHVLGLADDRRRRRAAVLSDPRQLPARQGVVPAVDAAVRRQLGLRGMGFRAWRRSQAEQRHPLRQESGRPVHRVRLRAKVGRHHDAAGDLLAHYAQPGPRLVLGAAEEAS